jgi:beta-mannanase
LSGTDTRHSSPRAWWASSRRRARWTFLGATALVLTLVGVSAAVWISPQNSPIDDVTQAFTQGDRLLDERGRLLSEVVDLKAQIAEQSLALENARGDVARGQASLRDLRQQLAAAEQAGGSGGGSGSGSKNSQGVTSTSTPIIAPSRAELVAPARPYFGMYTEQAPFNWATLDATAAKVGAEPGMVGYFSGWDENYRANAVTRAWQRGMLPLMTWESRPIKDPNNVSVAPDYSLPRIIGGAFDDYLRQYARDIVATGLPLAIRLDHEMNGTWYPWSETDYAGRPLNGNNRGDYVKMWQHVHDIFQQEGANELVIWVWAPNRIDKLLTASRTPEFLASLYPGDQYVDWVGMSGYLRPPYGSALDFDSVYGKTLQQLRGLTGKPILLAEVGASEIEGHKPAFVKSFFEGLNAPQNADIVGFSWFSLAITTYIEGERGTNDWRIDSRGDSLAAFREGLLAPGSRYSP